jgi:squalene-hopene/tetraprenyl-beta-curcumene cyclase
MRTFVRFAAIALVGAVTLATRPARAADADQEMLEKGVQFLVTHQNADGSFGGGPPGAKPGDIGITALVVKSLVEFKTDNAELQKKIAGALDKAIASVLPQQQKDGSFTEPRSGLATYRTALAVMALVAVDKEKYKDQIAAAKKWLEDAQFDEGEGISHDSPHFGGWGYDNKGEKPDADLSNAQFAIAALKAAGEAPDSPVMKRAVEFVSRCQNDSETNKGVKDAKLTPKNDGGFFYGPSRATAKHTEIKNADGTVSYESYASMTYAGLVSLAYAGLTKDDPRVKAALNWIQEHYTFDENSGLGVRAPDPKLAQQGLYYFYMTCARALDALGADEVDTKDGKKKWARDLLDALKTRQKPDGSWSNGEADRWREGDPSLVTGYVLAAANLALKHAH